MSGQEMRQAAQPQLCSAGCGFYSNVGTGGLCSKCFRDQQQREQQQQQAVAQAAQQLSASVVAPPPPAPAPPAEPAPAASVVQEEAAPAPVPAASPAPAEAAPEPAAPSSSSPAQDETLVVPPAKRPSPTRCFTCNKKVGLTGFSCKCEPEGAVFCATHRYADAHGCTFNYKAEQQKRLEASNPVVQASKVQKL